MIAKSEGNPLCLEESDGSLVEAGALVGKRGAYRQARLIDTFRVPDTANTLLPGSHSTSAAAPTPPARGRARRPAAPAIDAGRAQRSPTRHQPAVLNAL